jgi:hypothetical protein
MEDSTPARFVLNRRHRKETVGVLRAFLVLVHVVRYGVSGGGIVETLSALTMTSRPNG